MANDRDADNDPLTVTQTTSPDHGTAVINPDDTTVTYTPDMAFTGLDSFEYTVSDSNGGTDTGLITIMVATTAADEDQDGIADTEDNCVSVPNIDQTD